MTLRLFFWGPCLLASSGACEWALLLSLSLLALVLALALSPSPDTVCAGTGLESLSDLVSWSSLTLAPFFFFLSIAEVPVPCPSSPSCRPAWLPSDFPWIGAPLLLFFSFSSCLFQFPVPAPGLLNAPSSHWVCTLRSGRRDRGSFEQGVRLSAALEQNDSTTSLPKVASPSTATKIALWNPAAPWQDRRQGPMRPAVGLVTGSCGCEAGSLEGEDCAPQAVRHQLRACDVVVSGGQARQSRRVIAYCVKGRRETGRGKEAGRSCARPARASGRRLLMGAASRGSPGSDGWGCRAETSTTYVVATTL